MESSSEKIPGQVKQEISEYFGILLTPLREYFPDETHYFNNDACIRNTFNCKIEDVYYLFEKLED